MIKVSVIMPVYNNSKYLRQAIEGILNLRYKNIEFIIIDDFSNDDSINIINYYKLKYENIKLISHWKNMGSSKSIKDGIEISTGKYIFLAAADDISLPDRIEKHLEIYNENKDIGIIATEALIIDEYDNETGEIYLIDEDINNSNIKIEQFKRNYCLGATMSMINDKRLLLKESMFNFTDDYEISLEYLLNDYKIFLLKEKTVLYRIHNNNQSNNKNDLNRRIINVYKKYSDEEIINYLNKEGFRKSDVFTTLLIIKLFTKNYNKAFNYAVKAQKFNDFSNENRNLEINFYLGIIHYNNNNLSEALKSFKNCININNDNPAVLNNYAVINYINNRNEDEFYKHILRALKIKNDYLDAEYNNGCMSSEMKNFKITERLLEKNNIVRNLRYREER